MRVSTICALGLSLASTASAVPGSLQRPLDVADAAPAYRTPLLHLHRHLVNTPSVSGAEGSVGDWLIGYLEVHNYTAVKQVVPPQANTPAGAERFNVVAWPGRESPAPGQLLPPSRVLVTSHIDVVPPHIPYALEADRWADVTADTVIRGRGSVDAKGSVAAQITAVESLRQAGSVGAGDVALLYVVGEEDTGDGMRSFSEALYAEQVLSADGQPASPFAAAIFGEPTENRLACGHKGILGCTVTARGRDGHSGYPWLGKSANEVLLRGLLAVVDADLGSLPVFGPTTVNIGRMDGGVAGNVIPAHAYADLAIRVAVAPQATGHEVVRARVEAALDAVDAEALSIDCSHGYGVVECNCAVEGTLFPFPFLV